MTFTVPKCPKCDHTQFAIKSFDPIDSRFKLVAVYCNACGAVVGITEYDDTGALIRKLAKKLGVNLA
jgi:transcription elongation factor Elf1